MQFVKRTGVFIGLFLLMPIILYPLLQMSRYPPHSEPLPFFLVDLGAALLFVAMAFFFLARKKIFKLKMVKRDWKDSVIFGIITIFGLSSYLYFRYFTSHNVTYTWEHRSVFVFFLLFSLVIAFTSLIFSVFGRRFVVYFVKNFKKELIISTIMVGAYYAITLKVRNSWIILGDFVAKSVAWLLSLSFDNVVLRNQGSNYTLGAQGFVARIGSLCSGIDSMTLFLGLFALILAIDWQRIDKKRMAILFLPGLIGTIVMNILRIYLLYVSGIYISPAFAVGMFHSNAGWVLFIIYFIIFWYFAYPWVTRRDKNK